jgi:hypothetical protein
MKQADYQILKEASWRRPLTAAERTRLRELLAAHPEWRQPWEAEEAMNRLLQRLPSAAVSTNFTARVVGAAQRLPVKPAWRRRLEFFPWFPAGWIPRAALALAMLACGFTSFQEYQISHRAKVAQRLLVAQRLFHVGRLAAVPSVDWLKHFDTINKLDKVQVADEELLTALQ